MFEGNYVCRRRNSRAAAPRKLKAMVDGSGTTCIDERLSNVGVAIGSPPPGGVPPKAFTVKIGDWRCKAPEVISASS